MVGQNFSDEEILIKGLEEEIGKEVMNDII